MCTVCLLCDDDATRSSRAVPAWPHTFQILDLVYYIYIYIKENKSQRERARAMCESRPTFFCIILSTCYNRCH